jgi:hypothetical protein
MKNTRLKNLRIAVASVIICFSLGAGAAQAGDDRNSNSDKRSDDGKFLLISFDENFSACPTCGPSQSTIDGTTTLAGAFSDKGPRHQDNTVVSVSSDGKQVVVTGTVRISGSKGMLTTQYTGTIQFDGTTNIAYIEGTEYITGGTGAYAKAKGNGTFEATIDFDTNNIVGVAELNVKAKK